jgi:hypothetical protein
MHSSSFILPLGLLKSNDGKPPPEGARAMGPRGLTVMSNRGFRLSRCAGAVGRAHCARLFTAKARRREGHIVMLGWTQWTEREDDLSLLTTPSLDSPKVSSRNKSSWFFAPSRLRGEIFRAVPARVEGGQLSRTIGSPRKNCGCAIYRCNFPHCRPSSVFYQLGERILAGA